MIYKLRIAGIHFKQLRNVLYLGDGKEAGAIAVCSRQQSDGCTVFLLNRIYPVPSDAYQIRDSNFLAWDTRWLADVINDATAKNLSLIKFHSHPSGFDHFSEIDDQTDTEMLMEWKIWYDNEIPHGSAIMLPDGKMFGRVLDSEKQFIPIDSIAVAGDQYHYWSGQKPIRQFDEAHSRNLQTFGAGTTAVLQQLKIGVIGCSGTGSIVVEQLARLGVGQLVLVDSDTVEEKNLNRILNATLEDAKQKRYKVDVLGDMIDKMGFGTHVLRISENLISSPAIREVSACDVVFGCMDGAEGRHILNRIATYYLIPYFDVGIALEADGRGGISQITGAIHYLQPGGSSLLSRGVYTQEQVAAAAMLRTDPVLYAERRKQNYIANAHVDSPAVLPVNMHYASLLVLEFLARVHRYRITRDADMAAQQYNLEDIDNFLCSGDGSPCESLAKRVGRGDVMPLLDIVGME